MNQNTDKLTVKESGVSKTGYRALFLLRLLLESPKTRDELIERFSKDSVIAKDLSKDTVTNTVNLLRMAGCIITRPNMRTDFRYVLREHPFSAKLSKFDVKCLQALRNGIISLGDWQLIESVNALYGKIVKLTGDAQSHNELIYNQPLNIVDKKVLYDLVRYAKVKKTVSVLYDSAANGIEHLEFIPDFIQFENEKLYVWGYSYKYKNIGYLRVDKIKSVDIINFSDNSRILGKYFAQIPRVTYKLSGYAAYMFKEDRLQKIIDKNDDHIVVEATIYSEFNFVQKLLMYGYDCEIVAPTEFREKFVSIIREMRAPYE